MDKKKEIIGYKPRKWDEILTDDELEFAEQFKEIICLNDLPLFQVKRVVDLILEFEDTNELYE